MVAVEDYSGPETMIANYGNVYKLVYGQLPRADYVGNQWFKINGEMVHYRMLADEIDQLRDLAYKKRRRETQSQKGVVRRLIDKLRQL